MKMAFIMTETFCVNHLKHTKEQSEYTTQETNIKKRIKRILNVAIVTKIPRESDYINIIRAVEADDGKISRIIAAKERTGGFDGFYVIFKLYDEYFFMSASWTDGYITKITKEKRMAQSLDCIKDEEDKKRKEIKNV